MKRLIYTTSSCDTHSLDMLKVFLYTLRWNGTRCPIVVGLVNDKHNIKEELRKLNEDVIDFEDIKIKKTKKVIKRKTERIPYYNVMVMYSRPLGILKYLDVDQLLSIDTDLIIRGSLNHIWDGVVPSSIKVWDRTKKKNNVRFQGGVVIYGCSDELKEYYREVLRRVENNRDFYTYQTALFEVWQESDLKKIDLPKKYNDTDFGDGSIVWHCKHSHFNEPKYQNEFKYYLKKANESL